MSPREPRTLAAWLVHRKGLRQGTRILGFIITWAIAREDLDREDLKVEEFADYWGEAHRTSYRDLERFREVFEGYGFRDPDGLLAVLDVPSESVAGVAPEQMREA